MELCYRSSCLQGQESHGSLTMSSGSLLLRIRLQNNNTKLETQSKVIPSEQGVQKRYEAVELRYRGPGVISCEDLVPVGWSIFKALIYIKPQATEHVYDGVQMSHLKVSLPFRRTTKAWHCGCCISVGHRPKMDTSIFRRRGAWSATLVLHAQPLKQQQTVEVCTHDTGFCTETTFRRTGPLS